MSRQSTSIGRSRVCLPTPAPSSTASSPEAFAIPQMFVAPAKVNPAPDQASPRIPIFALTRTASTVCPCSTSTPAVSRTCLSSVQRVGAHATSGYPALLHATGSALEQPLTGDWSPNQPATISARLPLSQTSTNGAGWHIRRSRLHLLHREYSLLPGTCPVANSAAERTSSTRRGRRTLNCLSKFLRD